MSSARRLGNLRRAWAGVSFVVLGALAAGCVAGCGSPTRPPAIATTVAPTGLRTLTLTSAGVSLQVPSDWMVTPGRAPLVSTISSGPAIMALWRFRRPGAPPTGALELTSALRALERAAAARDRSFHLEHAGVSSLDGAGAVIIDALESVSGQQRRVRSEHVYLPGAELVFEAFAPVAQFRTDDHLVFSPVRRSLALLGAGSGSSLSSTTTR